METARSLAASEPIDSLIKDDEHQHPIAMMLLSKRLFDAGRRDEAVFWFYEGQLRWRAYLAYAGDKKGSDGFFPQSESERYQVLCEDIGPDINSYAGGDVLSWAQIIGKVLDWDAQHQDDFTPNGTVKDSARKGLENLAAQIQAHQDEMQKNRVANGLPAVRRAGDDPFDGSGGAMFGTPVELVRPYQPALFAAFRIGTTTRANVLQILGAPEMWSTDDSGASTFTYSYMSNPVAMGGAAFAQRLLVTFEFDSKKMLTAVNLPSRPAN